MTLADIAALELIGARLRVEGPVQMRATVR
jgi:hypothetical protein